MKMTTLICRWWPWVTRHRYEVVKQENYTLRDALREANAELRKHRALIAGLRGGDAKMTAAVERVFEASREGAAR